MRARLSRQLRKCSWSIAAIRCESGRGGSLIATGAKRFVEMVDELATGQKKQTDALAPLGFKVYYLRYAWAQDVTSQYGGKVVVIPGVASILRSLLTSQTQPQVLGMREQYLRPTVPGLRGRGMANQGTFGGGRRQPYARVGRHCAARMGFWGRHQCDVQRNGK